jgi:hypothetical protein
MTFSSAISWEEHINLFMRWCCPLCTRPPELDLNSANSLEQQCTENMSLHWAQYTDSEPTSLCLYSLPLCVYITFIVFGLTPCLSNTRSTHVDIRTWCDYTNHYTIVTMYSLFIMITNLLVTFEYVGKQTMYYLFHNSNLSKFVFKYIYLYIFITFIRLECI